MSVYKDFRGIMSSKNYNFSNFYNEYYRVMCDGKTDTARKIAEAYLDKFDDPNIWMIYGRIMLSLGEALTAKIIFRDNYSKVISPHISDLIHAKISATIAIVDDRKKILYIPIPKCGSTTIKSYLVKIIFNEDANIDSHERLIGMQRLVEYDELDKKYADYYKFAIIRPASDRVRSYYTGNFMTGHVKENSWNLNSLKNLTTNPSPQMFLENFYKYREVFLDVRHHTDLLTGYLPPLEKLDVVYNMSAIDNVRVMLEEIYGSKIDASKKMVTNVDLNNLEISEDLKFFYKEEDLLFEKVEKNHKYYNQQ